MKISFFHIFGPRAGILNARIFLPQHYNSLKLFFGVFHDHIKASPTKKSGRVKKIRSRTVHLKLISVPPRAQNIKISSFLIKISTEVSRADNARDLSILTVGTTRAGVTHIICAPLPCTPPCYWTFHSAHGTLIDLPHYGTHNGKICQIIAFWAPRVVCPIVGCPD